MSNASFIGPPLSSGKNHTTAHRVNHMEQVLPMINFVFIIFGTIGNLATFFLLMRKNVHKHSSMRYLAALCLVDMGCLYTWNFSIVYKFFQQRKIEHESAIICRLFSFYCYFILQASSWLIVAIGFDRLLTFLFKKENQLTRLIHNSKFLIAATLAFIAAVNFVVLVNNAVPVKPRLVFDGPSENSTFTIAQSNRTYTCYEPANFYLIWDIVHIVMYSILPFVIILAENFTLAYLTMK
jgi:uncharacterized membrane protein YozB (DUF420 family)